METIATSLSEAMEELAEIVSTLEEGNEISRDPSTTKRQIKHTKNI